MKTTSSFVLAFALAIAMLPFSGCSDSAPTGDTTLLPAELRSPVTTRIREKIETGGVVDIAIDVSGDFTYLATHLDRFLDELRKTDPEVAQIPFNTVGFITALGLDNIGGFGLSSRPLDENRFRNLSFVQIEGPRRGVMKLTGGEPAPFRILEMADASVELAFEIDLDLRSLNETIGNAAEAGGGAMGRAGWTALAVTPIPGTPTTALDILNQLETRAFFVLDIDPSKTLPVPIKGTTVDLPAFHWVLRVEGLAPVLDRLRPRIESLPNLNLEPGESGFVVRMHVKPNLAELWNAMGIDPVLHVDTAGNRVTFASNLERAESFGTPTVPLGSSELWEQTAVGLPTEGNSLSYVSPTAARAIKDLVAQALGPDGESTLGLLDIQLRFLGLSDSGYAAVSQNLPDGIFTIANAESTHKPAIVSATMYNPVFIGALAAMAIPAFEKTRSNAHEMSATNNLRMIASAGMQLMLEEGTREASYDQILASGYIPPIQPVAGESYDHLVVESGGGTLKVTLNNGTVVSYDY